MTNDTYYTITSTPGVGDGGRFKVRPQKYVGGLRRSSRFVVLRKGSGYAVVSRGILELLGIDPAGVPTDELFSDVTTTYRLTDDQLPIFAPGAHTRPHYRLMRWLYQSIKGTMYTEGGR